MLLKKYSGQVQRILDSDFCKSTNQIGRINAIKDFKFSFDRLQCYKERVIIFAERIKLEEKLALAKAISCRFLNTSVQLLKMVRSSDFKDGIDEKLKKIEDIIRSKRMECTKSIEEKAKK
jgi:hypothetical protein